MAFDYVNLQYIMFYGSTLICKGYLPNLDDVR